MSAQDVTVNLGFSGTATEGVDYGAWQEFILVKAGDLTGEVQIQSIPDGQVEGDESIIVDVTSVVNGTETAEQSVAINLNGDDTPADDSEFLLNPESSEYEAVTDEATGKVDLLSVLMHELGHAVGLEHDDSEDSLMNNSLGPGTRSVEYEEFDLFFSSDSELEVVLNS